MSSRVLLTKNTTPPLKALVQALPPDLDLSDHIVLMPDLAETGHLRQLLLAERNDRNGLLLPYVNSLRGWLEPSVDNHQRILNNHARELMLIEVLRESRVLRGQGSAWQLADELLKLFDELELSNLDAESLAEFMASTGSELFIDDANQVSRLWQARLEQMKDEGVTDRVQLYSLALSNPPPARPDQAVLLCGFDGLQQKEMSWLKQNWESYCFTVLTAAASPLHRHLQETGLTNQTSDSGADFLDTCFASAPGLLERASQYSWPSTAQQPPLAHCQQHAATSPEQEARFIDAQIRQWLSEGKQNIALITEDRQLARRVSAMLQHANVNAHDDAGWPLSTTVAAGVLERWMECLEGNFPRHALLDVIKSPFVQIEGIEQADIFHFERDIIEHERIASGLDRYTQAVADRYNQLDRYSAEYRHRLDLLLDRLIEASRPVRSIIQTGRHRPRVLLDSLEQTLAILGIVDRYRLDAAGMRLLQELDDMRQSEAGRDTLFSWQEFRQWLRRSLETHNFRPAREPSPVRIISLQQSLIGQYDGVILAGFDDSRLPRPVRRLIFFNDQVKQQLGLASARQSRERQLFQFRRLLEQTPQVVISFSTTSDNTPQLPSPWLSRINSFRKACIGSEIDRAPLGRRFEAQELRLRPCDLGVPPAPPARPSPHIPTDLLKHRFSGTSHQQLIDCPYKYFAAYALTLKAPEEIIELLSHRDYGERAHRCLQAFHSDVQGVPGPFPHRISDENRAEAEQLLVHIGRVVFDPDSDADVRHRHWFKMWREMIPEYLTWQQAWEANWLVSQTECGKEKLLSDKVIVYGKIDRVDHGYAGSAIIDYKSGALKSRATEMENGEDVQLSTYALLLPAVHTMTYLSLKANLDSSRKRYVSMEGEQLKGITSEVGERLIQMVSALAQAHPLPANGDEAACRFCAYDGLCRREMWETAG